ncbi:hypothetical protein SDC9_184117 [bioreactor metagenome]|uniref:Uncharacterized protein n=1 Tax=bioreactor metagenome TaxID=1076179 RepID=A0A645HC49_9ZZZZ
MGIFRFAFGVSAMGAKGLSVIRVKVLKITIRKNTAKGVKDPDRNAAEGRKMSCILCTTQRKLFLHVLTSNHR